MEKDEITKDTPLDLNRDFDETVLEIRDLAAVFGWAVTAFCAASPEYRHQVALSNAATGRPIYFEELEDAPLEPGHECKWNRSLAWGTDYEIREWLKRLVDAPRAIG